MSSRIIYQTYIPREEEVFSILIPTWNNLDFAKLCVESIRKNSRYNHQIILHINDGSDGTLDWAKSQQIDHTHSLENIGICYALNAARTLASAEYIVYMNDDMYVCPDWDYFLREAIAIANTDYFFFSSTLIEGKESGNPAVIAPYNFGNDIKSFKEKDLLHTYSAYPFEDWNGATWPPNIVSKKLWDLVGGYSVEFSPGLYSDPDFSMKLLKAGVKLFKGISKSRVYHFQSKSTKKIIMNDGRKQFAIKWGLPSSYLMKKILRVGTRPVTLIEEKNDNFSGIINRVKAFIQKI